ncbi:MAG: prolyl oligopeptidase family serine peptidase [Bacteroidales bacterium]|nr:prolyl oligopeptidase family serine peptidase [Bacteroidales bacterium]MDD3891006.1 prolyl oligopeptidase family serine peptidase [Bacteroidales bacterium]
MRRFISTLVLSILFFNLSAQEVLVDKWLVAGKIAVLEPALSKIQNVKGDTFNAVELLKQPILNFQSVLPKANQELLGTGLVWKEQAVDADSSLHLYFASGTNSVGLIASYIQSEGFWKGSVCIESLLPFEAFIGDIKVASRYSGLEKAEEVTKDLSLNAANHKLLIKVFIPDTLSKEARLKVYLKPSTGFLASSISSSVNPRQTKTLKHLLEGTKLAGASISATGEMALITISEVDTKTEKSSYQRRIIQLDNNKILATYRNSEVSQLKWMPKGNKISYLYSGSVWVYNFDTGTELEMVKGLNDIASYTWSPTEQLVFYYVDEKPEEQKGDMRRILSMEDRQSGWRNRQFLYTADIKTGIHQRLTWGNQSTLLHDISADGTKILFSTSYEDYSERPYTRQNLYQLNLNTRQLDTIWTDKLFSLSTTYSPNGKQLLAIGSPLAFGNIGVNVSDERIPNGFDSQAYLFDIESGSIDAITHDFNPAIQDAHWSKLSGAIYFNTVDEDRNSLYEYNFKNKRFTKLNLSEEVMQSIDFAHEKPMAVYTGSGSNSWPKAYLLNLKTKASVLVDNTDAVNYTEVQFGDTKDWSFTSSQGQSVTACYYLPPNFDSTKKYPMIVYYYGGTSPVGRDFGGRYPMQYYAANGFVVLVLQPSGAIGFGQDFSAAHVNAWGKITADEIIEGTQKFCSENSFVDNKKVGCMGASYGGFMTMYLLTQTDVFAAAISHAGISSISSYWGEGFWGYSYSAEASANSFPWNNRELYIDQSPLFSVDKVVTPLLLLHGSDDTNVPVGESIQMFTALKLLGKPVELIQIDGADHHIHKYTQRVEWTNTILAYFTKYLKTDDNWWKEFYPDSNY